MNRNRVIYRRSNRRYYRRRNRNIINKLAPNYSQRVQVMGPGRTLCRVTTTVDNDVAAQSNLSFDLNNIILLNDEFLSYQLDYEFFRVVCIKIIKLPSNLSSELSYFNCYVLWKDEQVVPLQLLDVSDKVKKIPLNNYKVVNFKFKPPDAMIESGDYTINPRKFMPTDTSYFVGRIIFNNPAVTVGTSYRLFLSIEVLVEFKGARRLRPEAKIMLLQKAIDRKKLLEKKQTKPVKKKKNKHKEKHKKQKEEEKKEEIKEIKKEINEVKDDEIDWKEVTSSVDESIESKGDIEH